jgi:hypothetical protein
VSDDDEARYDPAALRRLWAMSYEQLAMAPGEEGARLREARFILQTKLAYETQRSGAATLWTAKAAAVAGVCSAVAAVIALVK